MQNWIFGCPDNNGSKIVKHEIIKADEILITFGGGMGGGNIKYFAIKNKSKSTRSIEIRTVDGRDIFLTRDHIVYQEPVRLLKMVFNTHRGIETKYFRLRKGDTYTVKNEWVHYTSDKSVYTHIAKRR